MHYDVCAVVSWRCGLEKVGEMYIQSADLDLRYFRQISDQDMDSCARFWFGPVGLVLAFCRLL